MTATQTAPTPDKPVTGTLAELEKRVRAECAAELAALRRKGDALVILLDKAMVLDPLPIGVERDCVAAVAAWKAPAPSGDTAHDVLLAAYDVLTVAPELSPSNYDHDEVCELNSKALEAWSILDAYVNPKNAPASLPYDPTAGTTTMPAPSDPPGCRGYGRCVSLSKAESQSCCGCGAYEPDDEPAQGDKVCGTCGGTGRVAIRYRVNEQGFGTEPCPSCGGANG